MKFNILVKDELSRYYNFQQCCMLAEIYAIIKCNGTLIFESGNMQLQLECRDISLLKKSAALLKDLFDASLSIDIIQKSIFKGKRIYRGRIWNSETVKEIMSTFKYIELIDYSLVNEEIIKLECCRASFLRGIFLSNGYIGEPGRNYDLEFTFSDLSFTRIISEILKKSGIKSNIYDRNRNTFLLYVKSGDDIGNFLSFTGATNSLLKYENFRVVKATRGEVNRINNFDMANINRVTTGAIKQIKIIELLKNMGLFDNLDKKAKEIAKIRIENPYISLTEIGKLCNPPVSKSSVAYQMRKIMKLYEKSNEIKEF